MSQPSSVVFGFKTAFWTRTTSLYGSQISHVVVCMQNSVICTRMTSLYWFQPSSVVLCMQNSDFRTRLTSLFVSQTSSVVVSTHISVLSTRIRSLYLFQPSPVVLCMQNSDFRTRNTGPCWSKTPPVVFACKTATTGPEWQISMGRRHDLSFYACTTACLASELLGFMGPSPHLWLLHAKQRLLDPNNKSLSVSEITCHFVHAIQRD